jgi:hypothetical protein
MKQLGLESDDGQPQASPHEGAHSPRAAAEKDRDVGENAGVERAAGQPASLLDESMSLPLAGPAADTLTAGELDILDACTVISSCVVAAQNSVRAVSAGVCLPCIMRQQNCRGF